MARPKNPAVHAIMLAMDLGRPRRITVVSKHVNSEELEWMGGQAGIAFCIAQEIGGSEELAFGDELDSRPGVIRIPRGLPCAPEFWIASTAARRMRRVPNADQCDSVGLQGLLAAGRYQHPRISEMAAGDQEGVLLFKPGVVVTGELLAEVGERAAECGYAVAEGRVLPADALRELGLMQRHYRVHCQIAESGGLTAAERLKLLEIYDRPEFNKRWGRSPSQLGVMPVVRFLRETDTPAEVINHWSETSANACGLDSGAVDGPNEVGDDKYVNVFCHDTYTGGEPLFLLNPHMPSVTGWWERARSPIVALLLTAVSSEALSWARMRREFCGSSDPALAMPGSLRRDCYERLLPIRLEEGQVMDRTRNVVHLSNGPVEALRETVIWFDRNPEETATGRALGRVDGVRDLVECSYIETEGTTAVVTAATNGKNVAELQTLLERGRLLHAEDQAGSEPTRKRVDAAWTVVRQLRLDPAVRAVFATGSVARNRASADSDLDLVVVSSDDSSERRRIERRSCDGILVECEWVSLDEARRVATARNGDLKELREASRLGLSLPVWDPDGLGHEYERLARAALPEQEEVRERITGAFETLNELVENPELPPQRQWEGLRAIYDNLAVVMLSLNPVRYHKPKWVVRDLTETGHEGLAGELLRAYFVSDDREEAARVTADQSRCFLEELASLLSLPDYETTIEHGLVDTHPDYSYVCRCLADARSLERDGSFLAAQYTAKFSVRLGLSLDGARARPELRESYQALFGVQGKPPDEDLLAQCVQQADGVLAIYEDAYRISG